MIVYNIVYVYVVIVKSSSVLKTVDSGDLLYLNHEGLQICVNILRKYNSEGTTHMCILLSAMMTSLLIIDNFHMFFCTCDPFADRRNHLCIFPSRSDIPLLRCAGVRHVRQVLNRDSANLL